jgi:hypothetical protein
MNPQQETHLREIKQVISEQLEFKYRKGQQEHGGNLWERNCVEEAYKEATDLVTYLHTARENNKQSIHILLSCLNDLRGLEVAEASKFKIEQVIKILRGTAE